MDGKEPESEERQATRNSSMAYAAGLTIFFSVATCMGLGWALDRWLGTHWIMIAGIILGSVAGFYQFIRIISQLNK
jgi:F0F1-type ATP synthase assembly protein I